MRERKISNDLFTAKSFKTILETVTKFHLSSLKVAEVENLYNFNGFF